MIGSRCGIQQHQGASRSTTLITISSTERSISNETNEKKIILTYTWLFLHHNSTDPARQVIQRSVSDSHVAHQLPFLYEQAGAVDAADEGMHQGVPLYQVNL